MGGGNPCYTRLTRDVVTVLVLDQNGPADDGRG